MADVPEAVLAELLASGPDDFVATRKALAARIRDQGDRDLAAEVGKLRKPPVMVWRLNQTATADGEAMDQLVTAAAAARKAQDAGKGQDLRDATAAMRVAVSALAAGDVGLAQVLRSLAADEEALDALREGRLFALPGEVDLGSLPSRAAPGRPQLRSVKAPPERAKAAKSRAKPKADPVALGRARAAARKAEQSVEKALRALDGARKQLDEASARVEQREKALADARAAADKARTALDEIQSDG